MLQNERKTLVNNKNFALFKKNKFLNMRWFKKIVYAHANWAFKFKSKVFFINAKNQEKSLHSKQKQNKFSHQIERNN